jgi:hypothetical protein
MPVVTDYRDEFVVRLTNAAATACLPALEEGNSLSFPRLQDLTMVVPKGSPCTRNSLPRRCEGQKGQRHIHSGG